MTAFIANRDRLENASFAAEIQELLFAVRNALDLIRKDPELASHFLRDYQDQRLDMSQYNPDELQHCLHTLAEKRVYNQRPDMRLLNAQLGQTLILREELATPEEREKLEVIRKNPEAFFALGDVQASGATGGSSGQPGEAMSEPEPIPVSDSEAAKILCRVLPQYTESDRKSRRWQLCINTIGAGILFYYFLHGSTGSDNASPAIYRYLSGLGVLLCVISPLKDLWEAWRWLREEGRGLYRRIGFFGGLVAVLVITVAAWSAVLSIGAFVNFALGNTSEIARGRAEGASFLLAGLAAIACLSVWARYQRLNGGWGRAHDAVMVRVYGAVHRLWLIAWVLWKYTLVLAWRSLSTAFGSDKNEAQSSG